MVDGANEDVVMVEIAGGMFAFPAGCVREVVPLLEPTPMPEWPLHVFGLVDIRGQLIPLLDVSEALGRKAAPLSLRDLILVVEQGGRTWGVLVQKVEGVVRAPVRQPDKGDASLSKRTGLCRGLVLWVQGPVVLLDPDVLIEPTHLPSYEMGRGSNVP